VEELAGVLWRKRRLRLAEAAAHRRGLENSFSSYRETAKVALTDWDMSDRVMKSRGMGGGMRNKEGTQALHTLPGT
jgi:hypothetical protein